MMERHQAGQEDKLVTINMDPPSGASPPGRCQFSHTRALGSAVAVMALGLVLLCLTLYFFTFTPSCQQEHAGGGFIMRSLAESDDKGGHEVFTAETAGTYLIYVWVSLSSFTEEDVILKNTLNGESSELARKKAMAEVFFFQNVTLVDNSRISIYFDASCSNSLFHIHKA